MPILNPSRPLMAAILLASLAGAARSDDWPQWGGPNRDGVWREKGIVTKLPEKLKVVWRAPVGGGYAGPAIAGDDLIVMDRQLRSGEKNPDDPFKRDPIGGAERVLCFDAKTGAPKWTHEYPCQYRISYANGPRATVAIDGDRVYALGAMGDFFCLNRADGKPVWSKNFLRDFGCKMNAWGTSSAPLVDGDQVIAVVGGKPNACVVSFDKRTGAEKWRALESTDFGYCSPVIIEAGGARQLIVWTPTELASVDPAAGKVYWRIPFPIKHGMTIATPIHDPKRNLLFVTAFYSGPMMVRLAADKPAAEILWKGKSDSEMKTDGLHAVMCTPVFKDGLIYGVCSYGEFRCLDAETGERKWESLAPTGKARWSNAFITPHEDRYFLANERGDLILANLSPTGYEEISRAKLLAPTSVASGRRKVVWSHPAYAQGRVFARNDQELICVDISAP